MVQKFIDGKYVSGAAPVADRKKAAVPATEWLIKAVVYAHTDPEIKKAAIDLLEKLNLRLGYTQPRPEGSAFAD